MNAGELLNYAEGEGTGHDVNLQEVCVVPVDVA